MGCPDIQTGRLTTIRILVSVGFVEVRVDGHDSHAPMLRLLWSDRQGTHHIGSHSVIDDEVDAATAVSVQWRGDKRYAHVWIVQQHVDQNERFLRKLRTQLVHTAVEAVSHGWGPLCDVMTGPILDGDTVALLTIASVIGRGRGGNRLYGVHFFFSALE